MVAMSLCKHEIAAAAIADAMSVIYEVSDLDPASPVAVRLTSDLYIATVLALDSAEDDDENNEAWPTDYNPEVN